MTDTPSQPSNDGLPKGAKTAKGSPIKTGGEHKKSRTETVKEKLSEVGRKLSEAAKKRSRPPSDEEIEGISKKARVARAKADLAKANADRAKYNSQRGGGFSFFGNSGNFDLFGSGPRTQKATEGKKGKKGRPAAVPVDDTGDRIAELFGNKKQGRTGSTGFDIDEFYR